MAKSQNPNDMGRDVPRLQLQWSQTVHQVLNGGVTLGLPTSKNQAGVYNEFTQDTSDGVLIRIGAAGTTEQKYLWTTPGTGVVINHGLQRQPIGFKIVDKDKTVDVWRTAVPDKDTIILAPSDSTVNVTLYIF
jgi:hypothetical protein